MSKDLYDADYLWTIAERMKLLPNTGLPEGICITGIQYDVDKSFVFAPRIRISMQTNRGKQTFCRFDRLPMDFSSMWESTAKALLKRKLVDLYRAVCNDIRNYFDPYGLGRA